MRKIAILFFIGLVSNFYAQNLSFKILDSIKSLAQTDYPLAKNQLIEYEKYHTNYNPSDKFLFLYTALENKDTTYFKSEIQKLIQFNGFRYERADTNIVNLGDQLNKNVYELGLSKWLFKVSDSLYPIWVKNNPEAFEKRKRIDEMRISDQLVYSLTLKYDDTISELSKKLRKEYHLSNYMNVINVVRLADKNKILPNNFDHGVSTEYIWGVFLWHALSDPDKYEMIWKQILPFVDATYFAGKLTPSCYQMYDDILFRNTGFQYYGTLKDAPIKDIEHFEERKNRYKFSF